MILSVCGGRFFNDYEALCAAMRELSFSPEIIIEGGARGADSLARGCALENGVHWAEVPALWTNYHKAAGGLRNSAMLLLKPDYCLAMPGGGGTADMVAKCKQNNITVLEPYNDLRNTIQKR
jgi:hypothetical protein